MEETSDDVGAAHPYFQAQASHSSCNPSATGIDAPVEEA
jgi:hypothetical protein